MIASIAHHALITEQDVVTARQLARHIAELLGFEGRDQTRVATAVSEIARNAYRYARAGRVFFDFAEEGGSQSLLVRVTDQGKGIAEYDSVMNGTYVSRTGMGMGIAGAQRLMDSVEIETGETGTSVTLRKELPPGAHLSVSQLPAISHAIRATIDASPLAMLQQQNLELIAALDELQKKQQENARLNSELEETNRGVLALNAELEDKADSLRRASEMKTRFLSHMTHEFRTPLNSIRSLTRMLSSKLDGPLTEEQEKQVGFVQQAADSLLELVNDLLDLAKIESGRVDLTLGTFEIETLLATLRGMFRPLLTSDRVTLRIHEAPTIPPLVTDELKFSQILRNLISNAIKFTEDGSVDVTVNRVGDDSIAIAVRDTGVGIAPEHVDTIFDEFVQVQNRLQRRVKGTGIGLSLSKTLAEMLGGTIEVESRLGEGSTFTLTIPLVHPKAESASSAASSPHCSILIIDDDEADRYTLRALIPKECEVREAATARDGIIAAAAHRPKVIFLDLGLPDADGSHVLRSLRANESLQNSRIVIHTSRALSDDDIAALRQAGAFDVMHKGYSDLESARRQIAAVMSS